MRHLALLALVLALAGCSKKKPSEPIDSQTHPSPVPAPTDSTDADRARLLGQLKASNDMARFDAVEELSIWAETDPPTVVALLDLLQDKATAGSGKTNAMRITSTREAAVRALLLSGAKGEAALREKGFTALRAGLNDPQPAVREHTAYTIGLIGPLAKPLSPDVQAHCTDADAHVRGMAFDALRSIGINDVAGFATLLTNENGKIAGLAAELIPGLPEVPDAAVAPLTDALKSKAEPVRVAAAEGLAIAGPKAASAAGALVEAIKASYPAEYDPETVIMTGSEMAYWRALGKIGAPAVLPLSALLEHTNAVVRALAAQTLGEFDAVAKPATGKLKGALMDRFGFVAVEAACALCRIGEGKDEAVQLVRRAIDAPNNVAQTAIDAIPRMGEAGQSLVAPALKKLADKENPYARFAAIGLVGTLSPAESMKHAAELGRLATDEVKEIRRRAGLVLERLGPAAAPAAAALGNAITSEQDESLRDQLVDALIAMGPGAKPALSALLPLAADQTLPVSRREKVIAAVITADPESKDVAAALIAAAGDGDSSIRVAAATALGKLNPLPPNALAKLVALARSDPRTDPRMAALRALASAGPRAKSIRGDIETIASGKHQDGQALAATIAVAAMDGDATKAAAAVRAGLAAKKPDLRAAAVAALLDIGPRPEDFPALLKLLQERSGETRAAAAKCLGRLGPAAKDAIQRLARLLTDDPSGEVRIAAATALGDIGPAALVAVPKLKSVVRDDRTAEPAARKALKKLGEKN